MNKNVVTIGGGTGSPVIIQALIEAGFDNITAISAAMDSGGRTGAIRTDERDRVISVGDLWRNLIALLPPSEFDKLSLRTFTDLIQFNDGRQRNLGYTLYYALLEKYKNDFLAVQRVLEDLLGVKFAGMALPITLEPTTLSFRTHSGIFYYGEHQLDKHALSADMVDAAWCDPEVPATKETLNAIESAGLIVYCPGSLYGSLISNFLPLGVTKSLTKSKAQKVLITNLVSTRNETHEFTPDDYWNIFARYTGLKKPFDVMAAPDLSRDQFEKKYPQVAHRYNLEHSHFLGWEEKEYENVKRRGVEIIKGEYYTITHELQRLRHDSLSLADFFKSVS